ncbi:MAG: HTTM domain-containing protein [bacterium]|nr:HTTM domain-containing protein [bacterium]
MTATTSSLAAASWRVGCRRWLGEVFDQPASVRGVAVLRIVLGPSVIWHLRPFLADSLSGITYHDRFQQQWWPWFPNAPTGLYVALLWVGVAAAVLMTVGLWSRAATWTAFAVVAYNLFLSETHFHHNRAFLVILLAGVALCDNGRVLSLDARRRPPLDDRALVWPLWLLRFEVAVVYFASGFSKLIDSDWVGGRVLHDRTIRYQHEVRDTLGDTLADPVLEVVTARAFHWVLSPAAVATELFIAFGLWFRRTRLAAVWVAVAFHVGIEVSAQVQVFSVIGIGALALWAVPSTRDRTLVTPSRWVGRLDWMARFDITVVPGASWCMVDRDGTELEGREARQFVMTRLPATFLFSRIWRYR